MHALRFPCDVGYFHFAVSPFSFLRCIFPVMFSVFTVESFCFGLDVFCCSAGPLVQCCFRVKPLCHESRGSAYMYQMIWERSCMHQQGARIHAAGHADLFRCHVVSFGADLFRNHDVSLSAQTCYGIML